MNPQRNRVLQAFRSAAASDLGLTDKAVAHVLQMSLDLVQAHRAELVRRGWVRDSGHTCNGSTVWECVE